MKLNLTFYKLKKQLSYLLLFMSVLIFSQTNPALEMAGPAAANGVVYSYTTALQKNTNNPSGNTFAAYNTPSAINVTIAVTQQQYPANNAYNGQPGSLFFGDTLGGAAGTAAPAYVLMNNLGNAGSDNTQYTSAGVTAGTGIDIAANYSVRAINSVNALGANATNGRYKMGEVTITFSRPVNNPLLHFKGLGGSLGATFSFTAEFNVINVTDVTNTNITTPTTISLLSGSNLTVDNTTKRIDNSYTGLTAPATTNSGRGTVRFQGNQITKIVLEVYTNGNQSGQTWTANSGGVADAWLLGVTAGESDLQVTKTVSNATPTVGSNVNFTITANNNGASNNTNVIVNDLLPSGYTYVSNSPTTGTYTPGTGIWNIGNLNDGASATLTLTATVKNSGNYTNNTIISGDNADPTNSNNFARVIVNPSIDTDGDGVIDSNDLDDDNDGILDSAETGSCGAGSIMSLTGYQAVVYDAPTGNDGWTEVSSSTTFPTSKYKPIGLFDYNENAAKSNAFDINMAEPYDASNVKIINYQGTQIPYASNEDFAVLYNKTITENEAGTYQFNLQYGDDHIFIYKNGVKVSQKQNAYSGVPVNNFATISVVKGDIISILNIEENLFNTQTQITVIKTAGTCFKDTDEDGIPDHLDLDSDGDGCADAIEGDENVTTSQLTAGSINYSTTGGLGATAGTNLGVPNLVNSGGTADIGGDVGQGIGQSQDITKNDCLDNDNDGYADWQDLDDDNDGILDTLECPGFASFTNGGLEGTATIAAEPSGWSRVTFDEAYNEATISGQDTVDIFTSTGPAAGIGLAGNPAEGTSAIHALYGPSIPGDFTQEGIKQTITGLLVGKNYTVKFKQAVVKSLNYTDNTGRWKVFIDGNLKYDSEPTTSTLVYTDTNLSWESRSFTFTATATSHTIAFLSSGLTTTSKVAMGLDDIKFDSSCDFDNDGIPNSFDLDSDNDGCPDAIEGDENVTTSQLNANGSINTTTTGGLGATAGTNIGVPNLVNSGGTADIGSDVAQGIGNSQNAGINSCFVDAQNDINQVPSGSTATGNVITNDNSIDGSALTVTSATYLNASGVATPLPLGTATQVYDAAGNLAGTMTLNSNGTYTFVPATNYSGTVPVNYTATNSSGSTDSASISIEVIPATNAGNDKPIAQNDTASTEIGTSVSSSVLANDSDPDGNSLTVSSASIPLGTPTQVAGVDANGNTVPNAGTLTLNSNGTYTFVPAAGFTGYVNPVNYTISDGNGGTDTANLTITVLANTGNDTFANDDANSAPKGTSMNGNVLTNDSDPEGNTQSISSASANGTAVTIGSATTIPGVGTLTLNSNGTYTFVPLATFVGTLSVPYTVCDNGTPSTCDTATLYLTSLATNTCYKPAQTSGTTLDTNHGITALGRAGADNSNWPMVRKGAWTVLEAKTKGFVVNRLTDAQITAIPAANLVEGMMVYNITQDCLQINIDGTATGWKCFNTQACPE